MAFLKKRGKIWYAYYWIGKGKNRKKVGEPLSPNKQVANDKIVEIQKEIAARKYGHKLIEKSWESFKERYAKHSKTEKKSSTCKFDEYIIEIFEKDNSISSIQELTPSLLDEWKSNLHANGKKPATINRYLGLLKAMGSKAYEWGYVPENRYLTVKPMRLDEQEQFFYSAEDIKKIKEACETDYERVLVNIAFYSGLRRAEIQNLKWECVDFQNNIIQVKSTEEWSPKSYRPRYVAMNQNLKETLTKWRKQSKGEYVLKTNLKNIWILSKMFKKILTNAELTGSIHDARHTFITHLAAAGEDPLVLQREAGHSDFKTTNKIYTHLDIRKIETKINALTY